jgi:hypothetical protein
MEQYQRSWKNYYEILQVSPNAETSVISAAYKRLAHDYHPDAIQQRISQVKAQIDYHKHHYYGLDSPEISDVEYDGLVKELKQLQKSLSSATVRMTTINEAYGVLSDPLKRAEYDRVFRMHQRPQESRTAEATAAPRSSPKPTEIQKNWFQRHLHWTWFFTYLIWFYLNLSYYLEFEIIGLVILLIVSGWVIKQKGRSLWWILLTPVFSPLWLKNKKAVSVRAS